MARKDTVEEERIELRSEEFQEILGRVPPWILRWGIVVAAGFLAVLLIGSAVFKYPDTISCEITLTGNVPSAAINAKASGRLAELYVGDKQVVTQGQWLGIIENPAQTEDIKLLKDYLDGLDPDSDELKLPPKELKLGSMQSYYTSLYLTLSDLIEYRRLMYYPTMSEMMNRRMAQYEELYESMAAQKDIVEEQVAITRVKLERDSVLYSKGLVSAEGLSQTRDEYLQKMLSLENIHYSMSNTHMQMLQMKESLFESGYQDSEKVISWKMQIRTLIIQLHTEIGAWEQSYVLKTPMDGTVSFTRYWAVNQNVSLGEDVFNVIPIGNMGLLGKSNLPINRSGKVKTGQRVNVRFDNFPDDEFGYIRGIVEHISSVPFKDGNGTAYYSVDITFPDALVTTYKKELPFMPEMTGQAEIVTDDSSLLKRLMMPVRKLIDKSLY